MHTGIPEISLATFGADLRVEERRIPIEGTIEPTFRCNLGCVHCYANEPATSGGAGRAELSTAEWQSFLDQLCDAGCLGLLITGGEPLLRPDFAELYRYAVRKGLLITVFTNGTLLSDRIANLFDEYRPERIEITLYGGTQGTYERITQAPGSYELCMAGIRRVADRRLPLALKTMATVWNRHEIGTMEEFAASLGAGFIFDGQLNPRLDGRESLRGSLQLSAEDMVALDAQQPGRGAELREFCRRVVHPADGGSDLPLYSCGAGQTSFTIDPYGRLHLCVLTRSHAFDLRRDTFARGWNEHFPRILAQRWHSASPCRTCSLTSLCGSCPGAAQLECGDPEAPVPHFCEIAHRRAHAALGPASGHRPDASCCLDRTDRATQKGADSARGVFHGSRSHGEQELLSSRSL